MLRLLGAIAGSVGAAIMIFSYFFANNSLSASAWIGGILFVIGLGLLLLSRK